MADIGPQRAPESLPVNPLRPPEPAGSAHPAVLNPGDPSWMSLLPRGPSAGDMLSGLELQAKLQATHRADQGRNAMAQLYQDPANLDANGMLKPEAFAKLGAAGYPDKMLELMSGQAEIAQRQVATRTANQKYLAGEQERLLTDFAPLVKEYDDNVGQVGVARAREIGQEHYTELVDKAKAAGYSPAIVARINPQFDPERLRTNIMGLEGSQKYEIAKKADARADRAAGHADITSARGSEGESGNFEYRDDNGAVTTGYLQKNKDTGRFTDSAGKVRQPIKAVGAVSSELKDDHVGTVVGEDGKAKQVPLAYVPTNPPGKRYVDPATSQPVDATNIRKANQTDAVSEESVRASAEAIYEMRSPPLSSYAMGRGNGPRIMEQLEELGKERGRKYDAKNFYPAKRLMDGYGSTTPNSPGGQMNAANTAVQHLEQLQKLAEALDSHDLPAANAVINWARTQFGSDKVTNFQTGADIIADEVIKSVIGAGGGVTDRVGMQKHLSATESPDQIKGGIDTVKGLLGGRMNSLFKQWHSLGLNDEEFKAKLTEEAMSALAPHVALWKKDESARSESSAAEKRPPIASSKAPAAGVPLVKDANGSYQLRPGSEEADFEALPSGTRFKGPDGQIRVKP